MKKLLICMALVSCGYEEKPAPVLTTPCPCQCTKCECTYGGDCVCEKCVCEKPKAPASGGDGPSEHGGGGSDGGSCPRGGC